MLNENKQLSRYGKNKWKIIDENNQIIEVCRSKSFAKQYVKNLRKEIRITYTIEALTEEEFKKYNKND